MLQAQTLIWLLVRMAIRFNSVVWAMFLIFLDRESVWMLLSPFSISFANMEILSFVAGKLFSSWGRVMDCKLL